jgi:hypothetical protein
MYAFFYVTLLVTSSLSGMDDLAISPPTNLTKFPLEVQNYIAQFLPFPDSESEAEFIERTREPKVVPSKRYERFLTYFPTGTNPSNPYGGYGYCAYYSPDQTKIALLEVPWPYTKSNLSKPMITLIDAKKDKKIWSGESRYSLILVALSQHADTFAYIRRHIGKGKDDATEEEDLQWSMEHVLVIKNRVTKRVQKCIVPYTYFVIRSIGFNKQGTHIAVHGLDADQLSEEEHASNYADIPSKHHIIFPLKSNMQNKRTDKNRLLTYFRQQRVCKEFMV